jgi:hypothetical protein
MPKDLQTSTLTQLEKFSKGIIKNPNLLLDESFLDLSLSLTGRAQGQLIASRGKAKDLDSLCGSSCNTINFDLSRDGRVEEAPLSPV